MDKTEIFNNVLKGKFLDLLTHFENIEVLKEHEIRLVETSMKGFQSTFYYFYSNSQN